MLRRGFRGAGAQPFVCAGRLLRDFDGLQQLLTYVQQLQPGGRFLLFFYCYVFPTAAAVAWEQ